ncbi:MAG: hypothetical protein LQ352_006829 [Teloschistes flavicans]|nr:MAG: hypothetical protein LQ352_006829 [Teloschistes flavicans]
MIDSQGNWVGKTSGPEWRAYNERIIANAPAKLTGEEWIKWCAAMNALDSKEEEGTPQPTGPPPPKLNDHQSSLSRPETSSRTIAPNSKPKETMYWLAVDPSEFVTYLPTRRILPEERSQPCPTTARITRSRANEATKFIKLDTSGKQVADHTHSGISKRKRDNGESDTSAPNKIRKVCKEQEPSDSVSSTSIQRKRRHDGDDDDSPRKRLHLDPAPQGDPQTRSSTTSRPIRTRPLHCRSRDPRMMAYFDRWLVQPGLKTCQEDHPPPRESNVKYWCYSPSLLNAKVGHSSSKHVSGEINAARTPAPSIFSPEFGRAERLPKRTRRRQKNLDDTILNEITRFCKALNLPRAVSKQVEKMVQEIRDDHWEGTEFIPERAHLGLCIILACNKNGICRGFQEIAELVGVTKNELMLKCDSVWKRFTTPRRTDLFWKRPRKLI